MTGHVRNSNRSHRYQLVHEHDADFVAYQRKLRDGRWQTVSAWMIPGATARL